MPDIQVKQYSKKAIVVFGPETKTYKEQLKQLGGKYNPALGINGPTDRSPGWIFAIEREKDVTAFIKTGKIPMKTSPERVEVKSNFEGDLISRVKDLFSKMSPQEKIDFLGELMTTQPAVQPIIKKATKVSPLVKVAPAGSKAGRTASASSDSVVMHEVEDEDDKEADDEKQDEAGEDDKEEVGEGDEDEEEPPVKLIRPAPIKTKAKSKSKNDF